MPKSQIRATKISRPSRHRGPTNYVIDGYSERFRYVQGGTADWQIGMPNWHAHDAPVEINGTLCVVACVGSRFGLFAQLPSHEVYG